MQSFAYRCRNNGSLCRNRQAVAVLSTARSGQNVRSNQGNNRTNLEERADIGSECSFRCSRCLFSDPDEQPEYVKFSANKLKYKRISEFSVREIWAFLPRTSGRKSATLTGPNMQNVSRMTKG